MTKPTVAVRWAWATRYRNDSDWLIDWEFDHEDAIKERAFNKSRGYEVGKIVRLTVPIPAPAKARKAGK